jgi:predicted kinase
MFPTHEKIVPLPEALINRLQETPQNPRYHGEGSVWNHILMVLEQFDLHADEWVADPAEKEILYWACLLHDAGKVAVTRKVDGQWSARGHEIAGIPVARDILLQQNELSSAQRKQILDIVKWHHIPRQWGVQGVDPQEYRKLATETDLRLLGLFARFDVMGRVSEGKEAVLERVRLFNEEIVTELERELGTFPEISESFRLGNLHKKNALWNVLASGHYPLLSHVLKLQPVTMPSPPRKCLITIGPLQSGKTEYLASEYPDYHRIDVAKLGLESASGDADEVIEKRLSKFSEILADRFRRYDRVALDGTHLHEILRLEICRVAREQDAEIHYLFFERTLEEIMQKNSTSDRPFDEVSLRRSANQLDYPHPWEAHQIHIIQN